MAPHLRLDIVYESVGGSMFQDAVDNLAVKGRVILIGFISGPANTLPKQHVRTRHASTHRPRAPHQATRISLGGKAQPQAPQAALP